MLVCAHKERQALHYLGKEHQIGVNVSSRWRTHIFGSDLDLIKYGF